MNSFKNSIGKYFKVFIIASIILYVLWGYVGIAGYYEMLISAQENVSLSDFLTPHGILFILSCTLLCGTTSSAIIYKALQFINKKK